MAARVSSSSATTGVSSAIDSIAIATASWSSAGSWRAFTIAFSNSFGIAPNPQIGKRDPAIETAVSTLPLPSHPSLCSDHPGNGRGREERMQ
jgi:hypothetical protein